MAVQTGLCRAWLETLKTGFLVTGFIFGIPVHFSPVDQFCEYQIVYCIFQLSDNLRILCSFSFFLLLHRWSATGVTRS